MSTKYNSADLTSCMADPQVKLSKALLNRDIIEFRRAFSIGANALANDEQNLCIFEKALQTPGCGEFIKECLEKGCDPNYINSFYNKAAINFAGDSRDPENLKALLSFPEIKVDHKYSDLTALNSLAKNLNNENSNNVLSCIKILLAYGASPNIPDQREMTPLHNIVKNRKINELQKYEIVELFLKQSNIDIDTYREGELRGILEKEYPLMDLPERSRNDINFHSLLSSIRGDKMDQFEQQFNDKTRFTSKDENLQLLVAAIERGANRAFDLILNGEVDYNKTLRHNNTPLEIAWTYGNWYALEKLLKQPDILIRANDHPLINIVCKLHETFLSEFCNYWKCFYVLLDSDKIDINKTDFSRSSALHYAVRYHNNKAVRELLRRGACISVENKFHDLPLNGMKPSVLEEHLNDCICSSDDKLGDKNYEITISFQNFMTSQQKSQKQLKEVLAPIAFMAESKEYSYILQHPVITSILFLKWHKLSLIFYINFLLYLFYAISLTTYAVLKYRETGHEMETQIALYCSWLGICYLVAREFVQLIISPLKYFQSFTNYLELLLIVLSTLTCHTIIKDPVLQRNIAVACILLLAYDLVLLVGSLPIASISTHMLMLEAVCKSFVKCFLLYSIFIITFTLCFYIQSGGNNNNNNNSEDNKEEAFHRFGNILISFSKTIVMFTGEFDAGSLKLDTSYTYMLFLSFVFFMTIILFNLLNGLAVSDTQAIKDQAELNDIICRTHLLSRYEKAVYEQTLNLSFLLKRQPFRLICQIFSKLFPNYTTDAQISILPNQKNRIFASKNKRKSISLKADDIERNAKANIITGQEDNGNDTEFSGLNFLNCWFSWFTNKCSRIDERTVVQAMKILENRENQSIDNRLEGIEKNILKILTNLGIQKSDECE